MKNSKITKKRFYCERCEVRYEALVHDHEAGTCPKCQDTEWVIRSMDASDFKDFPPFPLD